MVSLSSQEFVAYESHFVCSLWWAVSEGQRVAERFIESFDLNDRAKLLHCHPTNPIRHIVCSAPHRALVNEGNRGGNGKVQTCVVQDAVEQLEHGPELPSKS